MLRFYHHYNRRYIICLKIFAGIMIIVSLRPTMFVRAAISTAGRGRNQSTAAAAGIPILDDDNRDRQNNNNNNNNRNVSSSIENRSFPLDSPENAKNVDLGERSNLAMASVEAKHRIVKWISIPLLLLIPVLLIPAFIMYVRRHRQDNQDNENDNSNNNNLSSAISDREILIPENADNIEYQNYRQIDDDDNDNDCNLPANSEKDHQTTKATIDKNDRHVMQVIPYAIYLAPVCIPDCYLYDYAAHTAAAAAVIRRRHNNDQLVYYLAPGTAVIRAETGQLYHPSCGLLFNPVRDRESPMIAEKFEHHQSTASINASSSSSSRNGAGSISTFDNIRANQVYDLQSGQLYERCFALCFHAHRPPPTRWTLPRSPTIIQISTSSIDSPPIPIRRVRPDELPPQLAEHYAVLLRDWFDRRDQSKSKIVIEESILRITKISPPPPAPQPPPNQSLLTMSASGLNFAQLLPSDTRRTPRSP